MGHTRSITALRSAWTRHRAYRVARRDLAHELADFRSPAERLELETIVERHSAEETREIRSIMRCLAPVDARL